MEISFIIRTDVHISDRAPASRCDDYMESCLEKLTQIRDLARERDVTAVLDNGDFFHNKSASRNSHLLVRKVADLHHTYPCPVYVNPGNHDFPYGNVDYVHQQPLGVLFSTRVFERMTDHMFEVADGGLKVRVVGFPYKVHFEVQEWDLERGDEDLLIVCAHTYATPEGNEWYGKEKVQSYSELAECSPDIFIFGHLHLDQGIQEVRGKTFFNLGSMTRGSLTEDNLERIPRVGYLSIQKDPDGQVSYSHEAIPLKVAPASEVFDLEKHERLKEERKDIDQFLDSLERSISMSEGESIYQTISNMESFPEDVRKRTLQYLDEVSS